MSDRPLSDSRGFQLAFRAPFDTAGLFGFLGARATPGVESVAPGIYRRTIGASGHFGAIDTSIDAPTSTLRVIIHGTPCHSAGIVRRIRRIFDLDADPGLIRDHLSRDRLLRPLVHAHPGIRVPGAWDGFELAVRAILGQQVSVGAATTIAGRLAARFGRPLPGPVGELDRLFPTAAQLVQAPLEAAGVMPSRAATIRLLSGRVLDRAIRFDRPGERARALDALAALPGIGPWTVQYIAMRAFGDRDAFPSGDLVLRRAAGGCTACALERRSQSWRPWRAYAVMLLWRSAAMSLPPQRNAGK